MTKSATSPNDPTNPNNPPSPTDPTNPPNPSGKATGATCVNSSECASNFCGTDSKCQIISGTNKKPNTYACTYSDECTSGFCDPADNTCSPKVVGDGGLGEGVGCVDTPQCATGLTCIGSNSTNRVCTSGGGSSGSCKGNTGGVNCGCDTDCNGTYKCLESYCVDPQG